MNDSVAVPQVTEGAARAAYEASYPKGEPWEKLSDGRRRDWFRVAYAVRDLLAAVAVERAAGDGDGEVVV